MCNDYEAPDFDGLADASKDASDAMVGLGQQQLNFSRQQYDEMKPLYDEIGNAQLDGMRQQYDQGEEYFDHWQTNFQPMERQMVTDAENFNTRAYREQLASQAASDAGLAFDRTNDAGMRSMRSMGVNPNSGAAVAATKQAGLALAGQKAGMMNNTRMQAEQLGWARKMDAVGLGRNMPGASTGAYTSATNTGNSAGTNFSTPGQQYSGNFSAGVNTIGSGYNTGLNGMSGVIDGQLNYNQTQFDRNQAGWDFVGGGIGTVAGLKYSDRRLKENVEFVRVDKKTGLNIYHYDYLGTGTRMEGVMADEVALRYPEAVELDDKGFASVRYDKLGITAREITA